MYKKEIFEKIGFSLLVLFFLSTFISKAFMNMSCFSLIFLSSIYIILYNRNIFKKYTFLKIMLFPIFLGFFLSFFSDLGIKGPYYFINRFRFILLLLPLTLFANSKKKYVILYFIVCISALIAVTYGIINPGKHSYSTFQGFHPIGRTADMMMLLSLSTLTYIISEMSFWNIKKTILIRIVFVIMSLIYLWALLFSAIRGAWLGFIFGFATLIIIYPKKTIPLIIISSMCFLLYNNKTIYENEFLSIFDLQTNVSNNTRLHLWKTGTDFSKTNLLFGTGVKNSEKPFLEFFNSQDKAYQEKYHLSKNYPDDFHNSYLQILIESGIIFLSVFFLSQIYLVYKLFIYVLRYRYEENIYLIVISITTSVSFYVSQFFHGAFQSYGSSLYYFFLFGGFLIASDFLNQETFLNKMSNNKKMKKSYKCNTM